MCYKQPSQLSSFVGVGLSAQRCAATLPVGETGVASRKGGAAEGNHPACTKRKRRKAGETAAPFIVRPLRRARAEPLDPG